MSFFKELSIGVVMAIGAILLIARILIGYTCYSYQEATGRTTKTEGLICFVQHGNEWYSIEQYKFVLVGK